MDNELLAYADLTPASHSLCLPQHLMGTKLNFGFYLNLLFN